MFSHTYFLGFRTLSVRTVSVPAIAPLTVPPFVPFAGGGSSGTYVVSVVTTLPSVWKYLGWRCGRRAVGVSSSTAETVFPSRDTHRSEAGGRAGEQE